MTAKQIEKRVGVLEARRARLHGELIAVESDLGASLGQLAEARKTEGPPAIKANKPKPQPIASAP